MIITVENNVRNNEDREEPNQNAHSVPCKIEEDGAAKVEQYFQQYIMAKGQGELRATFRGFPLDGKPVVIPDGYRAYMIAEAKKALANDTDRMFQVDTEVKEFTYWNWDTKPTENDTIAKAMDWPDVAESIHID